MASGRLVVNSMSKIVTAVFHGDAFHGDAMHGQVFGEFAVVHRQDQRIRESNRLKSSYCVANCSQEAHVALIELLYVVQSIHQHGDTLHSHAEGETADLFRIVATKP